MSPLSAKDDQDLPPEAIFNRYFLEYPEWNIRECYLGRQEPAELVGSAGFTNEMVSVLTEIRDHINRTYEDQQHRVVVNGIHPRLHFDYIKVKSEPCAIEKISRSNAIAFQFGGVHFVGITVPLILELLQASVALTRLGRITAPLGFRPDQLGRCRSFSTALFATMLQFVACHELGHHFHGHQGRAAKERGDSFFFYDESLWPDSAPIPDSQVKEVEADGYAVKMVMNNITLAGPSETTFRLLGLGSFTDRDAKYLVRLFMLATGAFFLSRTPSTFDLTKLSERSHPPDMARLHFITIGLRTWCRENNRPDLLRYLGLKRYQKCMKAILSATRRSGSKQAIYEQSAFMNSGGGRNYLNGIVRDVPTVRASMTPWRWQLISE